MKKARVLLADDHRILAEGLRSLLEPEFELVEIVEDGRALVARAKELFPDVIVADITMPLLNGIEAVLQLKKADVPAKVVFLTMHQDVTYAARAFELGQAYRDGAVKEQNPTVELTPRQREALQLFAEGRSAKEVAAILHISPRTAEFHKASIMKLLGIRTTAELTQYAVRHGIISS